MKLISAYGGWSTNLFNRHKFIYPAFHLIIFQEFLFILAKNYRHPYKD